MAAMMANKVSGKSEHKTHSPNEVDERAPY